MPGADLRRVYSRRSETHPSTCVKAALMRRFELRRISGPKSGRARTALPIWIADHGLRRSCASVKRYTSRAAVSACVKPGTEWRKAASMAWLNRRL